MSQSIVLVKRYFVKLKNYLWFQITSYLFFMVYCSFQQSKAWTAGSVWSYKLGRALQHCLVHHSAVKWNPGKFSAELLLSVVKYSIASWGLLQCISVCFRAVPCAVQCSVSQFSETLHSVELLQGRGVTQRPGWEVGGRGAGREGSIHPGLWLSLSSKWIKQNCP